MYDPRVRDYRAGVNRLLNRGHVPKSSLPMNYAEMKTILEWLDDGNNRLCLAVRRQLAALFSIAWICMLRMDEALKIKMTDLRKNRMELRENKQYRYHEITIKDRKTDAGKVTETNYNTH